VFGEAKVFLLFAANTAYYAALTFDARAQAQGFNRFPRLSPAAPEIIHTPQHSRSEHQPSDRRIRLASEGAAAFRLANAIGVEGAAAFRLANAIGVEGAAAFRLLKKPTSKSKGLQARPTIGTRNNFQ
jgi:hypothetical protein